MSKLNFYEALKAFKMDELTLIRAMRAGMPFYRKGFMLRFDGEKCLAWLEKQRALNAKHPVPTSDKKNWKINEILQPK